MYCYNCSPTQLTGINALIFFIGTMCTGIISGFVFTSIIYGFSETRKRFWEKEVSESESESEGESEGETDVEEEVYEDGWSLDEVPDTNKDKEVLSKKIVIEMTPDGEVLMKYDFDRECFIYWSYVSTIRYVYLEVVARRFVTLYNCAGLYVQHSKFVKETGEGTGTGTGESTQTSGEEGDIESEGSGESVTDGASNEARVEPEPEPEPEVEEAPKKSKKRSVFASLKKYNTKKSRVVEPEKDEVVNGFVYKGSILDFDHFDGKQTVKEVKNVDYKSFKKGSSESGGWFS